MARGYLMDVNHIAAFFNKNDRVIAKAKQTPSGSRIFASSVTLGEIWAGNKMTTTTRPGQRNDYVAFVTKKFLPNTLPATPSTAYYYGEIMGRIWQMNPPRNKNTKTDAHLASLAVDVNDIWLVATAFEHGLTVLSDDKMVILRQCAVEVSFDTWT